ncbi:MAG TPA: DUF2505 family protein [Acidimicrobiia bacterium]|nr:DUF2505 family protein [Acidimicrobiia bacterium]
MRFDARHTFAAPPDAVVAAMLDPDFHLTLDLPDLSRPEVVRATPHRIELRYEFIGSLDPVARRLLAGRKLTWTQTIEFDAAGTSGRLAFGAEAEANRLFGSAAVACTAHDGETVRTISGELHVRVPLVGTTAERRIVPGLLRRLDVEAAALTARLSAP